MLSISVFYFSVVAVSTTVDFAFGHNDDNNFNYISSRDFLNMRPRLGFPSLSKNSQPDLFTADQIRQIINEVWPDGNQPALDYQDRCMHDVSRVATSIPSQRWAQSMIDADGKIPHGLMIGNTAWTGSYSECLAVQAPPDSSGNEGTSFGGKYCTLSWGINYPMDLAITTGLCVPDTCQDSDFANFTNFQFVIKGRNTIPNLTSVLGGSKDIILSVKGIVCQPKNTEYTAGAKAVLVIVFTFVLLAATGTSLTVIENLFPLTPSPCPVQNDSINSSVENVAHHTAQNHNGEVTAVKIVEHDSAPLVSESRGPSVIDKIGNFMKCFCVITNGAKLFDTSDKGGSELRCIHGIRFLSMAWVIFGHTYVFPSISGVAGNPVEFLALLNTLLMQLLFQATYSVDSFFVMSGFLLTHLFLREIEKRDGKISWLAFYLHRYWRLTGVYAVVLGFDTVVSWYLVSGPFHVASYENGCKKSWWWNLLYINNFTPAADSCMGWTWYLANDMQFYVISPIFLYFLWKRPKIGLSIVVSLFCASWISNFVISYENDVFAPYVRVPDTATIALFLQKMQFYFDKIYIKPYTRIGPYLIGVFLGYLLFQFKGRTNFLSKKAQAAGWILSTIMALVMIFGFYNSEPPRIGNAFYNAFNRCCFSASLAWVIFACLTGHGGPVNKLLSFSGFIPLSRLTYCAYLVHPIVMTVYLLSLPSSMILTHPQMVILFFGFLVASYIVALATSLLLESPTMAIEKFLRSNSTAKTK